MSLDYAVLAAAAEDQQSQLYKRIGALANLSSPGEKIVSTFTSREECLVCSSSSEFPKCAQKKHWKQSFTESSKLQQLRPRSEEFKHFIYLLPYSNICVKPELLLTTYHMGVAGVVHRSNSFNLSDIMGIPVNPI